MCKNLCLLELLVQHVVPMLGSVPWDVAPVPHASKAGVEASVPLDMFNERGVTALITATVNNKALANMERFEGIWKS